MTTSGGPPSTALQQARALYEAQDYPALVAALAPRPAQELVREPELGFLLAAGWRRTGEREGALELARRLAAPCRRRGNDRLHRRRLNLEGMLLFERGEVAEAEAIWGELHEAAARAGDEEYVANANNNLGVVCTLQARSEEALACYERALVAYQRQGDRRGLGQAHHNLGITYGEMGFGREADAHFRQAIAYARAEGSEDEIARTEQARALSLLVRGDPALAEATARRALRRFTRLGDPAGEGLAWRASGVVALGTGRLPEARERLDRALELARKVYDRLLEAESLVALAALERAADRPEAAVAPEREAQQIFTALGADRWGERLRDRLESIRVRHGA